MPGLYYTYKIVATCPGGSCSVSGVNPAAISAITAVPQDKAVNWCEKNGPMPLNGRMVWTNSGKARKLNLLTRIFPNLVISHFIIFFFL